MSAMGRTHQTPTDFNLSTLLNRAYSINQAPNPTTPAARAAELKLSAKAEKKKSKEFILGPMYRKRAK